MKTTKIISTAVMCCICFIIAGCGGDSDSTPGTPADMAGSWTGTWTSNYGYGGSFEADIQQDDTTLSGKIDIPGIVDYADLKGTVNGDSVTFGDINDIITFSGIVSNSTEASGTYNYPYFSDQGVWVGDKSVALTPTPDIPLFDITGTWLYSLSDEVAYGTYASCVGDPAHDETVYINQTGDSFTTQTEGSPHTYTGTVSGDYYSISESRPGETSGTVVTVDVDFFCSDSQNCSGIQSWTWTDGIDGCTASADFTAVMQ